MASPFELESTLTDRYQTTVPDAVRRALRLNRRDKIRYTIQTDGRVLLTRAESNSEDDPVLGQFLNFLARDLEAHPEGITAIDTGLAAHIQTLVAPVEVDLDAPLSPDDE
ncbi:type II toxin-antitoxin system PrlF family antitoxin [Methylomagnum sp.]